MRTATGGIPPTAISGTLEFFRSKGGSISGEPRWVGLSKGIPLVIADIVNVIELSKERGECAVVAERLDVDGAGEVRQQLPPMLQNRNLAFVQRI